MSFTKLKMASIHNNNSEEYYAKLTIIQKDYECLYDYYAEWIDYYMEEFIENANFNIDKIEDHIEQFIDTESHEIIIIKQANELIRIKEYELKKHNEIKIMTEEILNMQMLITLHEQDTMKKTLEEKKTEIEKIYDIHMTPRQQNNDHTYEQNVYSDASFELLLEYQKQIIEHVEIMYDSKIADTVYVDAPTGFGETFMMLEIIKQLKLTHVIFLSPRILINQTFSEFEKHTKKDNKCKIDIYCYQNWKEKIKEIEESEIAPSKPINLIIFDEAHYIMNETIYNDFEHYKKILLSATPEYVPINVKLLSEQEEFDYLNILQLINVGILADVELYIKEYQSDIDLFNEDLSYGIATFSDKNYKSIIEMIDDKLIEFKEGIVFFSRQEHCEQFYDLYEGKYNKYLAISNIKTHEIDEFVLDENNAIIITCEQIEMGFDCNKIDMVCFGSAYQSEQNVIQMIGRGLRQYKNKVLKVIIPVIENDIKKKNYEKIKTVIETMIEHKLSEKIKLFSIDNDQFMNDYVNETITIVEKILENNIIPLSEYILILQENNIFTKEDYIEKTDELNLYQYDDLHIIYGSNVEWFYSY